MRSRTRVLAGAVLAGTLALSGCSVYDVPLPGGADTGDNPIHVHLKFRDVLDLVPQSTVKVDDVTVGKVDSIKLDGYTADVTIELPNDIDLPQNTRAEIRQTSLLGEKFVSLSRPSQPVGELGDKDVIGLDSTGRNPEVEEVFSALAMLLNGGGVAQLKTIAEEFNNALDGREDDVRSVITQVRAFMGQLDTNKTKIVSTLENLNRLALQLRRQDGTIKQALDDIPGALTSIDRQRQDLVKMLQALQNLSGVGVRVIEASKASTIDSLRNLSPVLEAFADAGQDFPKSLQVFLTYPFVDEAVGRDPEVARNLHMGDFTNLSIQLNIDLANLPGLPGLPGGISLADLIQKCTATPLDAVCSPVQDLLVGLGLLPKQPGDPIIGMTTSTQPSAKAGSQGGATTQSAPSSPTDSVGGLLDGLTGSTSSGSTAGSGSSTASSTDEGSGLLGTLLGSLGLGRTAPAFDFRHDPFMLGVRGVDPSLGTLLLQGVAYK